MEDSTSTLVSSHTIREWVVFVNEHTMLILMVTLHFKYTGNIMPALTGEYCDDQMIVHVREHFEKLYIHINILLCILTPCRFLLFFITLLHAYGLIEYIFLKIKLF